MIYWKLSYKKKFLWNLVQIPLVIALAIWMLISDKFSSSSSVGIIIVLVAIAVTTLFYTYSKWRKEILN